MSLKQEDYKLRLSIADDFGMIDRDIPGIVSFKLSDIRQKLSVGQVNDIISTLAEDDFICGQDHQLIADSVLSALAATYPDFKTPDLEHGEHLEILVDHRGEGA